MEQKLIDAAREYAAQNGKAMISPAPEGLLRGFIAGAEWERKNARSTDEPTAVPPSSEHYRATEADPITLLTTQEKRGFFKGSAIKYIHRYDRKNGIEDLRKAQFYLAKLIEMEQAARSNED